MAPTIVGAFRQLHDDAHTPVDAVMASLQDPDLDISAFFDFVREEHPHLRRIAFAEHDADGREDLSWHSSQHQSCDHDMILWDPWDRWDFLEILGDALGCRHRRARSSWTDKQLFASRRGTDSAAIAVIVERYRQRIVRIALDVTDDTADAEDTVQDIYLALIEGLPFFDGACSPGHWINRVARRTVCRRAGRASDLAAVAYLAAAMVA